METNAPESEENLFRASRRLLVGEHVYERGDLVPESAAGKHLLMLIRTGHLVPLDGDFHIKPRSAEGIVTKLMKLFSRKN